MNAYNNSSFLTFLERFKNFLESRPPTIRAVEGTTTSNETTHSGILADLNRWLDELMANYRPNMQLQPQDISMAPLTLPREVRTLKICLIGDYAVGKTTLRRKYMGHSFVPNYLPTRGADFSHYITTYQGYPFELLIWDLAGQPRFQTVRKHYFLGSSGAVVVFDLTRPETFFNMFFWIDEFFKHVKAIKPIVILGNKSDLVNSKKQQENLVQYNQFCAFIQQKMLETHNILVGYTKTSAYTGQNVKKGFEYLLHGILRWIQREISS